MTSEQLFTQTKTMVGRRRPRSTTCSTPNRRRSGMATTAAMTMSLLTLFHSLSSPTPFPTTDAFTLPQSAARLPQKSLTQMLLQTSSASTASTFANKNAPIRTNKSLARLTHQQEISLLKQMQTHSADTSISQMARQTLLLHNLPLVQSIVTKTLRSRPHLLEGGGGGDDNKAGAALSRDDLLHEGTIGLAEAIDRYDLAYAQDDHGDVESPKDLIIPMGARLGTYATYWIRARILRAIQSREHAFRFPEYVLLASHRLVKAAKNMELKWDVVAELADYDVITVAQKELRDELLEAAGIKSDSLFRGAVRVRTMSQIGSTTPLESWMSPSASSSATSADDESMSSTEDIRETLSKFLVPREVEVLSLRYGLVTAEDEEAESTLLTPQQPIQRDYQAEAEEDLFGPNGMLSHYSTTPTVTKSTSKNTNRIPSLKATVAATSMQSPQSKDKVAAVAPSPPTLVPFKEIGKRMKFSGEYCRRTCSQALNKLVCAAEEGRLAESDFLLGF